MTGAPAEEDSTPLRSGRRLDDSVFEADDAHKYEGSLMKLTAKPPYQPTPRPKVTDDLEMDEVRSLFKKMLNDFVIISVVKFQLNSNEISFQAVTGHAQGSLDQMKAIQSLIDSRRAMGTTGTTASPLVNFFRLF